MTECHVSSCENHTCRTDPDYGPFCNLSVCVKTRAEIARMLHKQRSIPVYDFVPEEEKGFLKEFLAVTLVVGAVIGTIVGLVWLGAVS